jgi:hypothetical protein
MHATPDVLAIFRKEHTIMHLKQRLWQWVRDRRIERQALKSHHVGRHNCSQDAPPLASTVDNTRLRLLKSDPGPRIV